jgi:hypothetical protein
LASLAGEPTAVVGGAAMGLAGIAVAPYGLAWGGRGVDREPNSMLLEPGRLPAGTISPPPAVHSALSYIVCVTVPVGVSAPVMVALSWTETPTDPVVADDVVVILGADREDFVTAFAGGDDVVVTAPVDGLPIWCGGGNTFCRRRTRPRPEGSHLLIVRPHSEYLRCLGVVEDQVDQTVLNADAPRMRAGEAADELLEDTPDVVCYASTTWPGLLPG